MFSDTLFSVYSNLLREINYEECQDETDIITVLATIRYLICKSAYLNDELTVEKCNRLYNECIKVASEDYELRMRR